MASTLTLGGVLPPTPRDALEPKWLWMMRMVMVMMMMMTMMVMMMTSGL